MEETGSAVADFCEDVLDKACVRGYAQKLRTCQWGRKGGRLLKGRLSKLTVRSREEGGNVERTAISTSLQLKMARPPLSHDDSAIATRFQAHRRIVPRVMSCVADFHVGSQMKLLHYLTRWLEELKPNLRLAAASEMYDETVQRMKVPMPLAELEKAHLHRAALSHPWMWPPDARSLANRPPRLPHWKLVWRG